MTSAAWRGLPSLALVAVGLVPVIFLSRTLRHRAEPPLAWARKNSFIAACACCWESRQLVLMINGELGGRLFGAVAKSLCKSQFEIKMIAMKLIGNRALRSLPSPISGRRNLCRLGVIMETQHVPELCRSAPGIRQVWTRWASGICSTSEEQIPLDCHDCLQHQTVWVKHAYPRRIRRRSME